MKIKLLEKKLSKIILITLIIIGCIITGFYWMIHDNQSGNTNYYYVGVASTFGKDQDKNDMLQGLDLALKHVNKSGGVNGKKIKLVIQNDKNDSSAAMKIASSFARDDRILFVIGHYYSIPSLVASDIYRKNAMPVITASATYDQVTQENEWYFRTSPNNSYYAEFIGTVLGLNMQQWPVVIITGDDDNQQQITRFFSRTIQKYGVNIIKQFTFTKGSGDVLPQLTKISNTIKRFDKKRIIFISAATPELVELVRLLNSTPQKYDFKIAGTDSAATSNFIQEMSKFPREKNEPGYYSNNLITLSVAIPGTGNLKTFQFYRDFYKTYRRMPSWAAATYYDTFMLSMQAIKRAELTADKYGIRNKRRKFKNALNEFYDYKNVFNGVTGDIFFDNNGDAKRPLIPAHYQDNILVPEFFQYQRYYRQDLSFENIKQSLNNDIVVIDETVLNKKQVVFTNIKILSVEPFLYKNQMFSTVDFFIKFRFSTDFDNFDDHNIRFVSAQNPVSLTKPVMEKTENGETQRVYRVKANFYHHSDYQSFPFDQHDLLIQFHHNRITADYLTYVPSLENENVKISGEWLIKSGHYSIDTVEDKDIPKLTVIKDNLYYTQVNAGLILSRKTNVIRSILPFIIVTVLLYGVFFVPVHGISGIIMIVCTAVLVNSFYYYKILSYINLSVLTNVELLSLFMYGLSLLTFISGICISICHAKKQKKTGQIIRYSGIVFYPIILGVFLYWVFF